MKTPAEWTRLVLADYERSGHLEEQIAKGILAAQSDARAGMVAEAVAQKSVDSCVRLGIEILELREQLKETEAELAKAWEAGWIECRKRHRKTWDASRKQALEEAEAVCLSPASVAYDGSKRMKRYEECADEIRKLAEEQ